LTQDLRKIGFDATRAVANQTALDGAPDAENLRVQLAQFEAERAYTYIGRRIDSGSTPIQVMEGAAMALGYFVGRMIPDSSQARILSEIVMVMRSEAKRGKADKASDEQKRIAEAAEQPIGE
jgi:hypothetical protein